MHLSMLTVVNALTFVRPVLHDTCFKSPFLHLRIYSWLDFTQQLFIVNICMLFIILYKFFPSLKLSLLISWWFWEWTSPSYLTGKFWLILFTLAAAAVVQAPAPVDALSWFLPFLPHLEHSDFFALFWPHSSHFQMFHPHICPFCGHCLCLAAPQLSHFSAHQPSHCNNCSLWPQSTWDESKSGEMSLTLQIRERDDGEFQEQIIVWHTGRLADWQAEIL